MVSSAPADSLVKAAFSPSFMVAGEVVPMRAWASFGQARVVTAVPLWVVGWPVAPTHRSPTMGW